MPIKTIKLKNGEIFKYSEDSSDFKNYLRAGQEICGLNDTRQDDSLYSLRQDDALYSARQLEYIRQQIFKPNYSELKFINGGLIPLNTSIPEGADIDSYEAIDGVGEAEVISEFSDDIKTTEVTKETKSGNIRSIATSYFYSVQDLRKDKMIGGIGQSTALKKAEVARETIDKKLDLMLRTGHAPSNIKGLLNADGVPSTAAAATGTGSTTTFATKTASNILADFTKALEDMGDLTNGSEIPDTCLIDYKNYLLIKNKPLDTTMYSGMSVLKYIEQEYQLKIISVPQLKNAFVGNTKSGFVLYKNSPLKLEGVLPIRLLNHPAQVKNLSTRVILEARCGGVRVFYPKSVSITTGI